MGLIRATSNEREEGNRRLRGLLSIINNLEYSERRKFNLQI